MKYTVRYAHLETVSVKVGQMLKSGDKIGVMGNTGQSTGVHLHIDVVAGRQTKKYTMEEIDKGKFPPVPRQLNLFIDDELFGVPLKITTYYCEPEYMATFRKLHYGYDVVPLMGDRSIFWNRSAVGEVTAILENDPGYGNCVMVCYETNA